jgi:cobalt-zinc-cadmium efflux system outer membrane protein
MRSLVTLAVAALAWAPAAAAQPASGPRVSLTALVEEAAFNNPEVAAARARYEAALQRPAQERSLPDPMVSAGYSASGRPYPGAGLGSEPTANIGVMVTQEIPYPGKLGLRASLAGKEAEAAREDIAAARLSVVSRVKQAYYRLAYTYAAADVLARNRELLDTLLKVSEARYGVGSAAQQDVFKGQAELTVVQLQEERLLQERRTLEAQLNALLNRSPGGSIGRPDDLQFVPFDLSADALLSQARAHAPMLLRDRTMVARAEIGVESARRDYKPDFALSGGYYNMGSMPAMYEFRFDIRVPLQRAKRAAAVKEQSARVDEARRAFDATGRSVEARLQEDYQMASTSSRLAALYRDTLLPQVRLALESSLSSYQTGSVDFLSVLTNFSSVLDNEMRYLDELASFHIAASRLEEMTGAPIAH